MRVKASAGRGDFSTTCLLEMREYGRKTKAMPIEDRDGGTLQWKVGDKAVSGTSAYTYEHKGNAGLGKEFEHDTVNHSAKEL